jgi:hypothetical protein
MPRKFLSIRQSDLDRELDAAITASRAGQVDARAMILEHEKHQHKWSTGSVLARIREAYQKKRQQVSASRQEASEDGEHPSLNQWRLFVACDDFIAFILYCLRIDIADDSPSIDVSHWIRQLHRVDDVSLARLFVECVGASIDEWEQDDRHGQTDADSMLSELFDISRTIESEKNIDRLAV